MVESGRLRLNLLGPLQAWHGRTRLDLGPMKQQALLAALVLRPGATVSQSRLLDDVWGEAPPASGTKALAPYVYRLRNALREPVLSTEPGGAYRFRSQGVTVDVARFRQLHAAADAARVARDWASGADCYSEAVACFRGEPLSGLPGEFAEYQRRVLADERLNALRRKLECELALGQHAERIGELSALVREHPCHEPFAVLLMRALHADGRQADALDTYARLRSRLCDELGVLPGADTERTYVEMLRGKHCESPQWPVDDGSPYTTAEFQQTYRQLPETEREAFVLLSRNLTADLDSLLASALLDCPPDDAERTLKHLSDNNLLQRHESGRYRLIQHVAVNARRHTPAVAMDRLAAAHTRALRLYLTAARCASDQGVAAFGELPPHLDNPFADHDDAMAWLDQMSDDIVDMLGHAADNGHGAYVCWLAEALTDYFTRRGRFRECHAAIDTALPLADAVSDGRLPAALRVRKGIAYGMAGRFEQSEEWLRRGGEAARDRGDIREWARSVGGLGTVSRSLGRDEEAIARLTEALGLAERVGDDWLAGMAQCNLGDIHHRHARHAEAADCYTDSLARAEKIGQPRVIGKTLCFIGALRLDLGQHELAATRLRRAVSMAERSGDIPLRALTLTRLGSAEQGLGNMDTAIAVHRQAMDLLTHQSSLDIEVEVRNRLASCLLANAEPGPAGEQFRHVLALTESGDFRAAREIAREGLKSC